MLISYILEIFDHNSKKTTHAPIQWKDFEGFTKGWPETSLPGPWDGWDASYEIVPVIIPEGYTAAWQEYADGKKQIEFDDPIFTMAGEPWIGLGRYGRRQKLKRWTPPTDFHFPQYAASFEIKA